jgi:FKBP-type peptidyl-prolyl cis-trans isomerase FkpA
MKKIFLLLFFALVTLFVACSKDDDPAVATTAPFVEYPVQYATDIATIERYLNEYYMEVSSDQDVTFTKIPTPNPEGKVSIMAQMDYPIQSKIVSQDGVDYKLYYIPFNAGAVKKPCTVDSIYIAYEGMRIYHKNDEVLPAQTPPVYVDNVYTDSFTSIVTPTWNILDPFIQGWKEILPLFRSGEFDTNPGPNPVEFNNFGAGVMFIPSGLGYYNNIQSNIPAYSNLIFTFKLFDVRWRDNDRDGILSKNEVANLGDDDPADLDTDADGLPNYVDADDDNDGILTKFEIHKDGSGNIIFEDCDGDTIPNYLDADNNGSTCN